MQIHLFVDHLANEKEELERKKVVEIVKTDSIGIYPIDRLTHPRMPLNSNNMCANKFMLYSRSILNNAHKLFGFYLNFFYRSFGVVYRKIYFIELNSH